MLPTNPTNKAFIENLLSQFTTTNSSSANKQILTDNGQSLANKAINQFMITDATLKQQITLTPKDFLQKLTSGELENTTSKVIVTGNLAIRCNSSLTKLPADLEVLGDFSIGYCENFSESFKNLKAKSFSVYNCNKITKIAGNIMIEDEFMIKECPALQSLLFANPIPNLNKRVVIWSCPILEQISDFTEINGNLSIKECPALTSLPVIEGVKGNILISSCPNITTIHDGLIANLQVNDNDGYGTSEPKVTLIDSGIPLAEITRYNQQSATGVNFVLDIDKEQETTFKNLAIASFYFNQFTDLTIEKLTANLTAEYKERLCELFFALAITLNKRKSASKFMQFITLVNKASTDKIQNMYLMLNAYTPKFCSWLDCKSSIPIMDAYKQMTWALTD